jgi:hypothetical protein
MCGKGENISQNFFKVRDENQPDLDYELLARTLSRFSGRTDLVRSAPTNCLGCSQRKTIIIELL